MAEKNFGEDLKNKLKNLKPILDSSSASSDDNLSSATADQKKPLLPSVKSCSKKKDCPTFKAACSTTCCCHSIATRSGAFALEDSKPSSYCTQTSSGKFNHEFSMILKETENCLNLHKAAVEDLRTLKKEVHENFAAISTRITEIVQELETIVQYLESENL